MVKWAFDVFISRNNGKTRLYWRHKDGYRINIGEGEAKFWCSQKKGEGRSWTTKVTVYSFKRIRNHFDERNGIMDQSANTRNCINNVTTIAFGTSATASYWPEIREGGLRQNQLCCISRTRLFQNQDKINFVQSSIYPATPPPMRADTVQIMIHETLPKLRLRKA